MRRLNKPRPAWFLMLEHPVRPAPNPTRRDATDSWVPRARGHRWKQKSPAGARGLEWGHYM